MKKQYLVVWQHPISKEWNQSAFAANPHTNKKAAIKECKAVAPKIRNMTYGVIEVNPIFTIEG